MNRRSFVGAGLALPHALPSRFQQSTPSATPAVQHFNFEHYDLFDLDEMDQSFHIARLSRPGTRGYFEDGIKRFIYRDDVYDHALTTAQYVMYMLSSFRQTGNEEYLKHAEMNLDHITSLEEIVDGRGFYPYYFDWSILNPPDNVLPAPWVSGMAQGQVLQAYNRYKRVTGSNRFDAFIDRVRQSFRVINDPSVYWSPTIDDEGNLWLEEYPTEPASETLNGHIFAIYGLYEDWMMTRDEDTLRVIQGAISTVKQKAMAYRREEAPSRYWLISEKYADRYHVVHIAQMLQLYRMTHDIAFANVADTFWEDYPPYRITGQFFASPGTYTTYEIATDKPSIIFGDVKAVRIDEVTEVNVTERRRLPDDNEFWYRCTGGPFNQTWLKEDPQRSALLFGEYVRMDDRNIGGPLLGTRMLYEPNRVGTIKPGLSGGYDAHGVDAVFPEIVPDLKSDESVQIIARELITAEDYALVESAKDQRCWIPTQYVSFDTAPS